ncbi:hypothetical protein [Dongia deserti]|uniref:hypothetical protein n=1 Tax=Dongia deserti TaxID=2268030 RepID=UPI000E65E877|nr:hypothetical protein [Dongia deserti]
MGLDLIVEGCAKPGHEREWRELLERSFADEELSEAEVAQFREVSIPGYERIGAPRVGHDSAANQWILKARDAKTPEEMAAVLNEFEGYYVVRLVDCDGVPEYSHGGMYDGADETSFRGSFLETCQNVLGKDLIDEAWAHKLPEQAVAYGRALLAAADAAEAGRAPRSGRRQSLLSRLWPSKEPDPIPIADQLDIVRAAGRWFVFWGERGHPIRAWF